MIGIGRSPKHVKTRAISSFHTFEGNVLTSGRPGDLNGSRKERQASHKSGRLNTKMSATYEGDTALVAGVGLGR